MNKQTRAHANAREDTTELERVVKMGIEKKQGQATVYCYTKTQIENILADNAQTVAEEAGNKDTFGDNFDNWAADIDFDSMMAYAEKWGVEQRHAQAEEIFASLKK